MGVIDHTTRSKPVKPLEAEIAKTHTLSARSPNDVLEIQNRYLQDSLRELLSFSERLSRLSADKAKEAGEHLDQNR